MSSKYFNLVLGHEQRQVWSKLMVFAKDFYLAGGTALALQIGHRRSYDFDFFTEMKIAAMWRERMVGVFGETVRFSMDSPDQLTWFTDNGVKITLAVSQQKLGHELIELDGLKLASVAEIASDKAFVLGRRGMYRDYIDLYFCLKVGQELEQIVVDAGKKYGGLFTEKLFLEQLVYLDDLSELVVETVGENVNVDEVARFLKAEVKRYVERRKIGQ